MTSMPMNPPALHLAGLGLPRIDFITPTMAELDAGAAFLAACVVDTSSPTPLQEAKAQGAAHIAAAKQALHAFLTFFEDGGFATGDGKHDIARSEAGQVADWFETILVAARDINRLADYSGRPDARLLIRYMGGSMVNKLHTIQAAMGDAAACSLFGAVGAEDASGNRHRVLTSLAESRIRFHALQAKGTPFLLDAVLSSYVVPVGDDRVALKAPLSETMAQRFPTTIPHLTALATSAGIDSYLIEGGDISARKFGRDTFLAFTEAAMASGKPLVFALPTDTKLVLGDSDAVLQNRAAMDRLMRHPETTILACNDAEAVAMFCNEASVASHLTEALARIQSLLKEKYTVSGTVEPIAFVSAGKEGSYAITPEQVHFSPSLPIANFVGTIGAGDAFFAGCFVAYQELVRQGSVQFPPQALQGMLHLGQRIARAVVGFKGAQLPPAEIAALVSETIDP